MTKEEWQILHDKLDVIYSDFSRNYHKYENGKNKRIRAEGLNGSNSAIRLADNLIQKNSEAFDLLTGGLPFFYPEFIQPDYFVNDMRDFLNKIKTQKQSLEDIL